MKRITSMVGITLMLMTVGLTPALGQLADGTEDQSDERTDWQAYFTTGFFSASTLLNTQVEGEKVKVSMDEGWMIGARVGADREYVGLEVTLAAVLADIDLKADPAADLPSAHDASVFLCDINFLWFPVGNALADGRIRPFATIGTGLGVFDTDYNKVENEPAWDVNIGGGIKFLLGDQGNPVVRLDYRWHFFDSSRPGLDSDLYFHELSLGIGIRF
jgi:opacity protein-like surface antigen